MNQFVQMISASLAQFPLEFRKSFGLERAHLPDRTFGDGFHLFEILLFYAMMNTLRDRMSGLFLSRVLKRMHERLFPLPANTRLSVAEWNFAFTTLSVFGYPPRQHINDLVSDLMNFLRKPFRPQDVKRGESLVHKLSLEKPLDDRLIHRFVRTYLDGRLLFVSDDDCESVFFLICNFMYSLWNTPGQVGKTGAWAESLLRAVHKCNIIANICFFNEQDIVEETKSRETPSSNFKATDDPVYKLAERQRTPSPQRSPQSASSFKATDDPVYRLAERQKTPSPQRSPRPKGTDESGRQQGIPSPQRSPLPTSQFKATDDPMYRIIEHHKTPSPRRSPQSTPQFKTADVKPTNSIARGPSSPPSSREFGFALPRVRAVGIASIGIETGSSLAPSISHISASDFMESDRDFDGYGMFVDEPLESDRAWSSSHSSVNPNPRLEVGVHQVERNSEEKDSVSTLRVRGSDIQGGIETAIGVSGVAGPIQTVAGRGTTSQIPTSRTIDSTSQQESEPVPTTGIIPRTGMRDSHGETESVSTVRVRTPPRLRIDSSSYTEEDLVSVGKEVRAASAPRESPRSQQASARNEQVSVGVGSPPQSSRSHADTGRKETRVNRRSTATTNYVATDDPEYRYNQELKSPSSRSPSPKAPSLRVSPKVEAVFVEQHPLYQRARGSPYVEPQVPEIPVQAAVPATQQIIDPYNYIEYFESLVSNDVIAYWGGEGGQGYTEQPTNSDPFSSPRQRFLPRASGDDQTSQMISPNSDRGALAKEEVPRRARRSRGQSVGSPSQVDTTQGGNRHESARAPTEGLLIHGTTRGQSPGRPTHEETTPGGNRGESPKSPTQVETRLTRRRDQSSQSPEKLRIESTQVETRPRRTRDQGTQISSPRSSSTILSPKAEGSRSPGRIQSIPPPPQDERPVDYVSPLGGYSHLFFLSKPDHVGLDAGNDERKSETDCSSYCRPVLGEMNSSGASPTSPGRNIFSSSLLAFSDKYSQPPAYDLGKTEAVPGGPISGTPMRPYPIPGSGSNPGTPKSAKMTPLAQECFAPAAKGTSPKQPALFDSTLRLSPPPARSAVSPARMSGYQAATLVDSGASSARSSSSVKSAGVLPKGPISPRTGLNKTKDLVLESLTKSGMSPERSRQLAAQIMGSADASWDSPRNSLSESVSRLEGILSRAEETIKDGERLKEIKSIVSEIRDLAR